MTVYIYIKYIHICMTIYMYVKYVQYICALNVIIYMKDTRPQVSLSDLNMCGLN